MHHKFSPQFIAKFNDRVDSSSDPDGCWPWMSGLVKKGYGVVAFREVRDAFGVKAVRAHRVAYLIANGEIPDGLEVCHNCDRRDCCNPSHLRADTHANNIAERNAKGRQDHGPNAPRFTPHDPRGHRRGEGAARAKLTADDVRAIRAMYIPNKRGFGYTSIAKMYGVNGFAIEMIIKRKSWAHIE